jgi:hypothetical protein
MVPVGRGSTVDGWLWLVGLVAVLCGLVIVAACGWWAGWMLHAVYVTLVNGESVGAIGVP